jgi:DNA-binding response OmpR family regulator
VRALEVAKEREPHLVVLDLMLPRMDGLAVCRALRESRTVPGSSWSPRTTASWANIG